MVELRYLLLFSPALGCFVRRLLEQWQKKKIGPGATRGLSFFWLINRRKRRRTEGLKTPASDGGSARWKSCRRSGNRSCRYSMRSSEVRRRRRQGNKKSLPKRDQKALLHYLDALVQKNEAAGWESIRASSQASTSIATLLFQDQLLFRSCAL